MRLDNLAKLYGGSRTSRYTNDPKVLGVAAQINARSQSPNLLQKSAKTAAVEHKRDNSNELSRSFRLTSKLSKWSEHNDVIVQAAVGGGGDAYGKVSKGKDKDIKKFKFYDERPHFS